MFEFLDICILSLTNMIKIVDSCKIRQALFTGNIWKLWEVLLKTWMICLWLVLEHGIEMWFMFCRIFYILVIIPLYVSTSELYVHLTPNHCLLRCNGICKSVCKNMLEWIYMCWCIHVYIQKRLIYTRNENRYNRACTISTIYNR